MLARLFISTNLAVRIEKIEKIIQEFKVSRKHPDTLYFEDEQKLGVDEVKIIKEFLSLKPYSAKGRLVILETADNLTLSAQNALLKSLEELPENSLFILGVNSENTLIPTLVSRVQIEYLDSQKEELTKQMEDLIDKIISYNLEDRFKLIEATEEKELVLKALLYYYQKKLYHEPKYSYFIKELLEAEKWVNSNVNIRAILEYLMFRIP